LKHSFPFKRIRLLLFILVLTFLCYSNSLFSDFVLDDTTKIAQNAYIKDGHYIPLLLKGEETSYSKRLPKGNYRPLLMLTFFLNYSLGKLNPFGYHMFNIAIHLFNVFLLYYLLNLLLPKVNSSIKLFCVVLFGIHPINTEAVSYISSRSDLLVASFLLLCMISFLQKRYVRLAAFFACALLTKESAVILIGILLCLDFFTKQTASLHHAERARRKKLLAYISIVGITLAYIIIRNYIFDVKVSTVTARSFSVNIATQAVVSFFYLRLFLFPYPLCVHHPIGEIAFLSPAGIAASLGIATLLSTACCMRKRNPLVGFCIGFYFISLAPKFIASLNFYASEHHAYFPLVAMYILGAVVLSQMKHYRSFLRYGTLLLIPLLCYLTFLRNFDWKNSRNLWASTLRINKNSYPATTAVISDLIAQGKLSEAQTLLNESLERFSSTKALLHFNVALLSKMGQEQEAELLWQEMNKEYLDNYKSAIDYAFYYYRHGDYEKAEEYFQEAVAEEIGDPGLRFYLASVYEQNGKVAMAKECYRKSIELGSRNPKSFFNLGTILAREKNPQAERYLKQAIQLDPSYAQAHYNLALFYFERGSSRQTGERHLNRAIALGYEVGENIKELIGWQK